MKTSQPLTKTWKIGVYPSTRFQFLSNQILKDSSCKILPHKHPTTYILTKNILDNTFYGRAIAEADLNKCEPWDLLGTSV